MSGRLTDIKAAIDAATVNGWKYLGDGIVFRSVPHVTPQLVRDNFGYHRASYSSHETLLFSFRDRTRDPKVIYGVEYAPWTEFSDAAISFTRALELLAQPVADSDVHNS